MVEHSQVPSPGPLRLLLVEDDPDDVALTRRLLKKGVGRETEVALKVARSAAEAEGLLRSESFDLALVDFRLPKIDGLELLERLHESRNRTPCLLLTGRGDERLVTRALRAGAIDYLPKGGLTAEVLATSIRHAVRMARERASRREAEKALSTLRAVEEIADPSLAHRELPALLQELLDRIRKTLEVDCATVLLRSPDGSWLVEEATSGPEELDRDTKVPFGRGLAGRVAAEGPMTFGDVAAEPEVFRPRLLKQVASMLAVPLLSEGEVEGVLEIGVREPREFTGRSRLVLQLAADRVGPLIGRARLVQELLRTRRALQFLSRRLLEIQEEERRDLARELHDELGQELTALKLALESNLDVLTETDRTESFRQMTDLISRLQYQVRDLSRRLRPPALDTVGLEAALEELFDQLVDSTGIEIDYHIRGNPVALPPSTAISAYRIVQEAITNAIRHADTERVTVEVRFAEELVLRVVDRGVGFDLASLTAADSRGLMGMVERAELAGGSVTVESLPGEGATIVARLPVTREREADG